MGIHLNEIKVDKPDTIHAVYRYALLHIFPPLFTDTPQGYKYRYLYPRKVALTNGEDQCVPFSYGCKGRLPVTV